MQSLVELPESLHERAIRSDEGSTAGIRLGEVWTELMSGRLVLADHFRTRTRCFLLLQAADAARPIDLDAVETFERVLRGEAQKCVAAAARIAASTVTLRCKTVLRELNAPSTSSKVPLVFAVLAHARVGKSRLRVGRRSTLHLGTEHLLVVSFPRAELCLSELASPSEYDVALLYAEGRSHQQIAAVRGTSRRTVANQLAGLFRKLRVSGRSELLAWIAREGAPPPDAPCERELLLLGV